MKLIQNFKDAKEIKRNKKNYEYVAAFKNGQAKAVYYNKEYNKYELVIVNEKYELVEKDTTVRFSAGRSLEWNNGHLYVCLTNAPKYSESKVFLDKSLDIVPGYAYSDICWEADGYIQVSKSHGGICKDNWGVLDKNLNQVIEPKYNQVVYLGNGTFAANVFGSKPRTYLYKPDEEPTLLDYIILDKVSKYKGHRYFIIEKNGKYGYLNEEFEVILSCDFETLYPVSPEGEVMGKKGKIFEIYKFKF